MKTINEGRYFSVAIKPSKILFFVFLTWINVDNLAIGQCPSPFIEKNSLITNNFSLPSTTLMPNTAEIYADKINGLVNDYWHANGNVVIRRDDKTIYTNEAFGDHISEKINLPSTFYITNSENVIEFAKGEYDIRNNKVLTDEGKLITKPFPYIESHSGLVSARALARDISFRVNFDKFTTPSKNKNYFDNVSITTCPTDNPDWQITAGSLTTYQDKQVGVAQGITLRIRGTPVFYLPWIDFPLNGNRKSGFLLPNIKLSSENNNKGFSFSLPYYFNLAPNYDWLLTPEYIKDRGLLVNNLFRYLTPKTYTTVEANGITKDNLYKPYSYDNNIDRYRLYINHSGRINKYLDYSILTNKVSDSQYLVDYGDNHYDRTAINLPIEVILNANYNGWKLSVGRYDYENLTENPEISKPYTRSPQISFSSPNYRITDENWGQHAFLGNIYTNVEGNFTSFTHKKLTNINRFWLYPKLQWQYNTLSGFAKWQVGVHLSQYNLSNIEDAKYNFSSSNRTVPIIKASGGLIFERELEIIDKGLQTLEPSIYWLYIPEVKQDKIPVIDTAATAFQLSSLDVDNLYSGWDRISDANVLSYGITSRFYDKNRRELININLGQRYYLATQKVLLPGEEPLKSNRSDFLFSAKALFDEWRIEALSRYDAKTKSVASNEVLISFQPQSDRLIGLRYIYQKTNALPRITSLQNDILSKVNLQEVAEGVIDWPLKDYLGANISFSGRNYYSLADKKTLETRIALRYFSCCMGVSLYRTNVLIDKNKYNQTWGIEFNLFGFGKLASKSERKLDEAFRPFRVK